MKTTHRDPTESATRHKGHLVIAGLKKSYQSQVVVSDMNLEVRPGEFVALLGPSGCGKTTVLRSIAGLVTPSAGDIRIDNASILKQPVHKRDLGMVFQSYALFPHLTVWQNVAFGLKMHGIPKRQITSQVAEALDLVQMRHLVERLPAQLSGGQQQRVALARAIVTNPTALLLDEPFSALDAKLRESMQIELRQLQRRLQITTIFVTHDQHEAMTMADRIAVMDKGRVEQFDSPQAVYGKPATLFVAEFIGKTNRMAGHMVGRKNGYALVRLEGREEICMARDNPDIPVGDPVLAVLRPEKIELVAAGSSVNGYAGVLDGLVSEVIFTGEKSMLFLHCACGDFTVASQNRSSKNVNQAMAGNTVKIGWNATDMLIFPLPAS